MKDTCDMRIEYRQITWSLWVRVSRSMHTRQAQAKEWHTQMQANEIERERESEPVHQISRVRTRQPAGLHLGTEYKFLSLSSSPCALFLSLFPSHLPRLWSWSTRRSCTSVIELSISYSGIFSPLTDPCNSYWSNSHWSLFSLPLSLSLSRHLRPRLCSSCKSWVNCTRIAFASSFFFLSLSLSVSLFHRYISPGTIVCLFSPLSFSFSHSKYLRSSLLTFFLFFQSQCCSRWRCAKCKRQAKHFNNKTNKQEILSCFQMKLTCKWHSRVWKLFYTQTYTQTHTHTHIKGRKKWKKVKHHST